MAREMKDSGIEWIGEIPANWKVSLLKFSIRWKSEKGQPDAEVLSLYRDLGVVPKNSRDDNHNVTSLDTSGYKVVDIGDFVINKMKAWQGSMAVSKYAGIVSPAYHVCEITNPDIYKEYFHHLLRNPAYIPEYLRLSTGMRTGQWDLGFDDFKNIPFIIPPYDEQIQIVKKIDHKCSEIDSVIADTQKTIEEYKALKQSIITEAVTKGVRGERKMKDSGVEWIGDVPEEWEVIPVKYVAEFQPSCDMSNLTDDSIITYLPMEHLKNGYYIQNTAFYGSVASSLTPFMNGDIVMAKVTPCFENGNIAIMNDLSSGVGMGSSELFVYRPLDVQTKYLLYWLQNILFKQAACATMTGTGGLKRVSPYFAKHSKMTLPCYKEQLEIIRYLDEKCTSLDKLIESKQQLLTELESYKKSVIYEYVTGKKECGIAVAQVTQAAIVPFYPAAISTKRVRFAQAVLMAKVLDKCHKGMGRVKLEKTMYTIETIIGFDFETEYVRQVAGPLDESLYKCEGIISRVNHWYTVCASQHGVSYKPTKNADKYQSYYCRYFRNYNTEIERIIDIFASYTTEQAEVIATLLAAWNDAIIEGKSFTDTDIVNDVLNNWSEEKKRFSKDVWLRAMDELRKKDLMPKGYGKKTVRRNIK